MEPNHRSLKGIQVGELDELLQQGHEPVKYDKKSEDTMRTPILVLHSSGSTGMATQIYLVLSICIAHCSLVVRGALLVPNPSGMCSAVTVC